MDSDSAAVAEVPRARWPERPYSRRDIARRVSEKLYTPPIDDSRISNRSLCIAMSIQDKPVHWCAAGLRHGNKRTHRARRACRLDSLAGVLGPILAGIRPRR